MTPLWFWEECLQPIGFCFWPDCICLKRRTNCAIDWLSAL